MTTSAKFLLPYLSVGQSQKEVTHNEALAMIDILLSGTVISVVTAPPGSPANGDTHIVASAGTSGVFVGKENKIAYYLTSSAAWQFITPPSYLEVIATSTKIRYRWTGSAWVALNGVYTPTPTNVSNINSSTAYACVFSCVGNVCTVSGKIRYNSTSTGAAQIDLSLPIASNFTAEEDLAGTAASEDVADGPMYIKANYTNDRASIYSTTDGTTNHDHFFTFQYVLK